MSTENKTKPVITEKKQITTALLKELMLGGKNRKEIAEHFGAPVSVINKFFKHPDLASIRPKHASAFELVDETGKTYSPGFLANAAKEAKAAETPEVEEEQTEVEPEAPQAVEEEQTEVEPEAPQAVVTESTGI